ncbi:Cytochrome monooxygenase CLM2 like protein [Verticillium longisporum]|nr:Cytochrome monooxygenase CLM2 like protein [Verticillium longisporum]KAH6698808.1 O-methylsterigmatocystin oxidoreductase [Verticillium dahliae]PNH47208.1 hypothetical protein VD0004_g1034 [Verticillium dahliae]PNH56035.1 hypothetical protein VD0003_g1603 [Verticillium dahliae]PNH74712.1 hypothetical protein VD0001_g2841 [Verticillium dahliae]
MAASLLLPWAAVALLSYLVYQYLNERRRLPLPPGPKPLPIVGNVNDFPPIDMAEHQHWAKHKDLYGPISSVTVLGKTLILINDQQMAHDLLEKFASKTSGRPSMVFANEFCGYDKTVISQGNTEVFRRYRKLMHRELGTKAAAAHYYQAQELEVNRQLVRTLHEPEKWLQHFKTTTAATILKMAYGYIVEPHEPDVLVSLVDKMTTEFSLATVPMAWPVDTIPLLRYIPENTPGVTFKKTARKWRKSIQDAGWVPYRFVQRQMDADSQRPSYVSKLVQQCKNNDTSTLRQDDEEAILWSAASLYGGAADTTVISLTAFTLAMAKFPDIQRKAQEEIDRVIGTDRLPSFDDRDRLPYINAVIKETLRWWPIAPMGFPHTANEELEYNGYRIPKNAILLPAVWGFLHDPNVYREPHSFEPERFLSPRDEPDPTSDVFGYGRRICPGRFIADSGVFINVVQSLAAFDVSAATDSAGESVGIDAKPMPGILCYPAEFPFKITPRSAAHVDLIRRAEKEHPWEASDAPLLET